MSALLGLWGRESESVITEKFISALAEHGALDAKNKDGFQPILSQITNSLSSGTTRSKGLLILKSLFKAKVIVDDVLISHGKIWLPLCVKTLRPSAVSPNEKALALLVIREILDASSKIHELERNVVSASLPDLVDTLIKSKPEIHGPVLSCLYTLLLCHSKSSGAFKNQIEKFLIQFLDSDNKEHVKLAAKCTHLLQQVRGGGEQGINHKLAWKNQYEQCTKSCHIILKELFKISQTNYQDISFFEQNSFESQDDQTVISKAPLRPFEIIFKNISSENKLHSFVAKDSEEVEDNDDINPSKSVVIKVDMLMMRLENMLVFIQALLVEPYSVAKQIKCVALFEVLLSCLLLKNRITNQEITLDSLAVILRAPSLRSTVMRTIKALIVCVGKDITPYSFLILKMVIQVLDESKLENDTGKIKAYKNTRKMAYDTLSFLLLTVHSLKPPPKEGDTGFEDQLIANFIHDIIPHKLSMQLTVKKVGSLKQMSKKARRKLAMSQLDSSNLPQNFGNSNSNTDVDSIDSNNSDLILAALSCLEAFFKSCGVFLKKNTHKVIQETLVKQIYNGSSIFAINEAFTKALLSVQYFQSQLQPMPLPYCLDIFSRNQHSLNINTAISSKIALSNCTSLIHGIAPPLNFCHEKISHDDTHQNVNNDNNSYNESENVDIIDVDNYSMNLEKSNQFIENNSVAYNHNKIFPNFGKRKNDDDFQGLSKLPKNSDNLNENINKNDSVTMHINIEDSSDSNSSMKTKDHESAKSADGKTILEDPINLVNTLSDDDNNDVVYLEINNILGEGVAIDIPNNNINDITISAPSNNFSTRNENFNEISFSSTQEPDNTNQLTIVEEQIISETADIAVDEANQNENIDSNIPTQAENINCEVDISVEAMMNSLVDEVQEEFE